MLALLLTTGADRNQDADSAPVRFKLLVEEPGIYAVTYEELVSAGLEQDSFASSSISVTNRGLPSALSVDDGGDGAFGPGDRVVFEGERLLGSYSYLDEYSRFNCYILDLAAVGGPGVPQAMPEDIDSGRDDSGLFVRHHFEEDIVMVRFPEQANAPQERWYWARRSIVDKPPFKITSNLAGLDSGAGGQTSVGSPSGGVTETEDGEASDRAAGSLASGTEPAEGGRPIRLRVGFRGWSKIQHKGDLIDHVVDISANGVALPPAEWDGTAAFVHEVVIPRESVVGEELKLELKVPKRRIPESKTLFVDVVLLNWIEVEYPRENAFAVGQSSFWVNGGVPRTIEIDAAEEGSLFFAPNKRLPLVQGKNIVEIDEVAGRRPLYAVIGDGFLEVNGLEMVGGAELRSTDRQADYLLITHRSLWEAVKPLADFHRERGLTVVQVDVEDIYEEFNHGIQNPESLRDFISWAYHEWQPPAPRFVLLAGDASWDYKNPIADDSHYADWSFRPNERKRFVKNAMIPYAEDAELNHRNLVPTMSYRTYQGHAASDNALVCVAGDDIYPDLAVGRIPVVRPEEMAAVIRKTIGYVRSTDRGDWQRRMLFITNESKGFQSSSDRTAAIYEERGYDTLKIYPQKDELVNEQHSAKIIGEFNNGLLTVQFLGHGGRYIWRTGPPDLKKNHDLFTLDHLDQLNPTERLPVVVSLTCYSAPFDHPSADSIGEKLLRLDGKGALAVFAASWRNSPSSDMGRIVFDELTRPGATIGEAVMRAKRQFSQATLIETYNLLGDPAVSIAVPEGVTPPPEKESEETAANATQVSPPETAAVVDSGKQKNQKVATGGEAQ